MTAKHQIIIDFDNIVDVDCNESRLIASIDGSKYLITEMNAEITYSKIEDTIKQALELEKKLEDIENISDDEIEVIE